ncbi:hypothetical protein SAMN05444000_102276 [Shimia gijangensis]|uniref:Spore coat protein U (SCPU) domain-containing protein n=1 Tax=Shimia gijangensis TaxID=1470563 RepID=A0A1M6DB61_9RHOB|nr:hypothetical protein [Shimia gijangensis]SHI70474.1 hypothetical protein SAMN05444000_102276 [Shimia gijangensis]
MKPVLSLVAGLLALCTILTGPVVADDDVCEALFVHSASDMSFDGTTLVMANASPMVTFFCDRPVRLAGHLTIPSFLDEVSTSDDPFSNNPPNAVISIVSGDSAPQDIVVTINARPTVDGTTLTYSDLTILDGPASSVSGSGTVFIDHFGRPMSPGSVAGVHRRNDRREVRECNRHDDPGRDRYCTCGAGLVCN